MDTAQKPVQLAEFSVHLVDLRHENLSNFRDSQLAYAEPQTKEGGGGGRQPVRLSNGLPEGGFLRYRVTQYPWTRKRKLV